VTALFDRYESALTANNVAVLNELFWNNALTLRYGPNENLYGFEAIAAFRAARPSVGLARSLSNTIVTTFGRDFASVNTEFLRGAVRGRQSQSWVRLPEGWRIVAAHVSLLKNA
jgi:hypothetical protein